MVRCHLAPRRSASSLLVAASPANESLPVGLYRMSLSSQRYVQLQANSLSLLPTADAENHRKRKIHRLKGYSGFRETTISGLTLTDRHQYPEDIIDFFSSRTESLCEDIYCERLHNLCLRPVRNQRIEISSTHQRRSAVRRTRTLLLCKLRSQHIQRRLCD